MGSGSGMGMGLAASTSAAHMGMGMGMGMGAMGIPSGAGYELPSGPRARRRGGGAGGAPSREPFGLAATPCAVRDALRHMEGSGC